MTTDGHAHPPRAKFDTLFADPRHYRGDCRLMRTAIRRGWLNDAPQADRDALAERFKQAGDERQAAEPDSRALRAGIAWAWVVIELVRSNREPLAKALRYAWAGEPTDRATGRPRERWHVGDCPGRIDAADVRRRYAAAGGDLAHLTQVSVTHPGAPGEGGPQRTQTIGVEVCRGEVGGWRVFLRCPRCQSRRVLLYATGKGIGCRGCLRIRYAGPPIR